ncbi:hypothetical protein BCR43DRAFT_490203 [Syncephalastrum racemosum]|uniref:Uncharacterized protein n=1 Tax=Syncephalastrum racemosum TaxID=13706 RepID=A0A1X2HFK1_SYNRA|nr:hypothetical protein BCR43DRAFT_490203 [Syncephalastrum racemosum]
MDASPTSALALSSRQQKRFGCCDFKALGAKPSVQPSSGTGVFAKISDRLAGWARSQLLSPKQNKRITLMFEGFESDIRARQQREQQQQRQHSELYDSGASSRMLSDDNKSNSQHAKVIQHQWQQRASLHRVTLDKLRRLHPRGPLFEMVHLRSLLARLQTEQHRWIMGTSTTEMFCLPRSDSSGGSARSFSSRPRMDNKAMLPLPPGPSKRIPITTRPTHTHRSRATKYPRTMATRVQVKSPISRKYDPLEDDESSSGDSDGEDDDIPLALVLQARG